MAWYHYAMGAIFALSFLASLLASPHGDIGTFADGMREAQRRSLAPLWVCLLFLSYVLSVLYVDVIPAQWQIVPSQFVGFMLDAIIMICIQTFHKETWEFYGLGTIVAFMLTADLLQLAGVLLGYPPPFSKTDFGVILEILNILALLMAGGVGLMDWTRRNESGNVGRHRFDYLSSISHHAHSKTDKPQPLRKW